MNNTILQANNLIKVFGHKETAVQAVKGVSLQLKRGEIILIIGPSGSGKTTLLSMIGLILTPTSGNLYIKDIDVSKLSQKQILNMRRQEIGFVFQAFNLLENLTVLENLHIIHHINSQKPDARAFELLKKVGLYHRKHHLPCNLSIGEKQRVAIVRALMNKPDLILADEPTGNLDSKSGHAVVELLVKLAKKENKGVIIVTHDQRLKDIPDRIINLEDGYCQEGRKF